MGLLDNLGDPLGFVPSLFRPAKPRTLADELEGETIGRLTYLADLGMFGGAQCLLELRSHRIAIIMAAPAPLDEQGHPKDGSEYRWHLSIQMMSKRLIVTKRIEAHMISDRDSPEQPADAVQKRVEGRRIERVILMPEPVPPHMGKGIVLALEGRVAFYIVAHPPGWWIEKTRPTPIQAELHLETREADRLISAPGGERRVWTPD